MKKNLTYSPSYTKYVPTLILYLVHVLSEIIEIISPYQYTRVLDKMLKEA